MKILLDEGLWPQFARLFPDAHQVRTVEQMGWRSSRNGHLLHLASRASFDALVTLDAKMQGQQSDRTLPFPVIVLRPRTQGIEVPGHLISSRVVPLLRTSLCVGFYEIRHDGRIFFKRPSAKRYKEVLDSTR